MSSLIGAAGAVGGEVLTTPEQSGYTRTSRYREVMEFIHTVAAASPLVTLATLTHSPEGREIPLVILSRERVLTPSHLAATGKPAVLIVANIHGGEVEGKEAAQMLLREVGMGQRAHLLDHQVILVIPILNTDGNEQLGKHRGDNGPELAGVRHNGQYLDLNRDFVKLESPEARALVRLFNQWDPILVVDMHTTNGSYHRFPVTYATSGQPNTAQELLDFMWNRMFPAVAAALRREGWDSAPYGNFVDAEQPHLGWINDSVQARYLTNYVGLRNRLAILDENYSYADFRTRVLSAFALLCAILEFSNAHANELVSLVRRADTATRESFRRHQFVAQWKMEKLLDVTIRGFESVKVPTSPEERARSPWLRGDRMGPTPTHRDYTIPYLALATPEQTLSLPAGYVVLPGFREAVDILQAHGLGVERLLRPVRVAGERFALEKVEVATRLYQGRALLTLAGHWEKVEMELPAGAFYVDLGQPLARLVPVLLEPSSADSLAAWGFFSRALVQQWTFAPGIYPVVRLAQRPPVPLLLLTP